MITELRRYRLKTGRVESWLRFFEETLAQSERHGIRVEYAGLDAETNTFVWLRSFTDEADRVRRKDAFYGDAWWSEREAVAMDHVLDYEVTFLDAAIVREGGALVSQRASQALTIISIGLAFARPPASRASKPIPAPVRARGPPPTHDRPGRSTTSGRSGPMRGSGSGRSAACAGTSGSRTAPGGTPS
ncbi:MAG: NIPSNAP family protein [Chloroflexi bacterium]|nr:NIPSNAP family protein [Chloroflexota bacterium]